jgi:molybdopterin synthase sulfur carrier subunit
MKLLYFAWLREKLGTSSEEVDLPPEVATVAELIDWLKCRGPRHAAAFAPENIVRCAVDQDFSGAEASIAGAREVAFFPPVTGG